MWGQEQIWLVALGGAALLMGNILYMMGGTAGFGKWYRRFLGSLIIVSATNVIALINYKWAWQYAAMYPLLVIAFSLGYDADTLWDRLFRRTIFAAACVSVGILGLWATGFTGFGWGILAFQFLVGLGSVYLGTVNPYGNAPLEQLLICSLITMTIPFWPYIK